ncbi:MAG: hypothetical protein BWY65_02271 [Firmicutes bacterium ADurb.Bin373]|nr:MAG: hypothetical protein BWY65_02271 [Firmicutes bacterium ADurb.Bin373]
MIKMLLTELLKAGRPKILLAFKRPENNEARPENTIRGRISLANSTINSDLKPVKPGATSLTSKGAPAMPVRASAR